MVGRQPFFPKLCLPACVRLVQRVTEEILRVGIVVEESFVEGVAEETLYREVMYDKAIGAPVEKQPEIGYADQHHADAVTAQPRNIHVLVVGIVVAAPLPVDLLVTPCQPEQEREIQHDGYDHQQAVPDVELTYYVP